MADFSAAQLTTDDLGGLVEGTAGEVPSTQLPANNLGRATGTAGEIPGNEFVLSFGPPVVGPVTHYKMRGAATPGPGYVTWIVTVTPDFPGTFAPSPIVIGSAVIADSWNA